MRTVFPFVSEHLARTKDGVSLIHFKTLPKFFRGDWIITRRRYSDACRRGTLAGVKHGHLVFKH